MELSLDHSWKAHISNITSKAERILNLLRRHLYGCKQEVKSQAFTSLVRPLLEYSLSVWDPNFKQDILAVEKNSAKGCPIRYWKLFNQESVKFHAWRPTVAPTSTTKKTETFNILQRDKQTFTDHHTRICQIFLWPYKNT